MRTPNKTTSGHNGGHDPAAPSSPPLRILCITEKEETFDSIAEHLREARFESQLHVSRALCLSDAMPSSHNGSGESVDADVVLLSLPLPNSSGPDLLDKIETVCRHVPVIVLGGNDDRHLSVTMVKRGVQDIVPHRLMSSEVLLRSILYALERQRSRREMSELNKQLQQSSEELKSAQMLLIQVEKLDSLGRLAAGVAHEVKNPLATLQMGVDYFRRKADLVGPSATDMADHMQEAISSADGIIRGMVDYSRSDALELKLCNINSSIRKALRMVRHEVLKHNVKLDCDLYDPIPAVQIDPGKIEQVLINSLANAMQAMGQSESDRTMKIRTFWGQLEEIDRDPGLRDYQRLRVRDHVVVVEIRDCGPGIPEEKLGRVFEPFFTTKPTGQGTGLGLSVAKNIIDLHRGHFQIRNVENPRGLRVRIFLKACELNEAIEEPALQPQAAVH